MDADRSVSLITPAIQSDAFHACVLANNMQLSKSCIVPTDLVCIFCCPGSQVAIVLLHKLVMRPVTVVKLKLPWLTIHVRRIGDECGMASHFDDQLGIAQLLSFILAHSQGS